MPSFRNRGWNLSIDQEWHEFWSRSEPDPGWVFVDSAGHAHRYGPDFSTPTLETVSLGKYWCYDCNDEHEDFEERCTECGEVIIPGTREPKNPTMVPGLRHISGLVTPEAGDIFRRLVGAGFEEELDLFLGADNGVVHARGVRLTSVSEDEIAFIATGAEMVRTDA